MATKRVRLTDRPKGRRAVEDNQPFPGTVGQPDRTFKTRDQYHTFTQTVNHELPDTATEWKDNPRDEVGLGVPKVAKIFATAHRAVRLAVLFLGDKVDDKILRAQARDFMRLGSARIDASLERFLESETMYETTASDEETEVVAQETETTVAEDAETVTVAEEADTTTTVAEDAEVAAPAVTAEEEDAEEDEATTATDTEEEASEEDKTSQDVEATDGQNQNTGVADPAQALAEQETHQLVSGDTETDALETLASEDEDEDEDETEDEVTADASEYASGLDVELGGQEMAPPTISADEQAELNELFAEEDEDSEEDDSTTAAAKPKKAGIKTLGGQPNLTARTASADNLVELWDDAPDVSDVF